MSVWINPYRPVETAADLPRFCGKCGRPMRPVKPALLEGVFDRWTGVRRVPPVAVQCPKGRFDDGHEAFIVSPRPAPSVPPPPASRP